MTDADVDVAHISTLLLTLFFRHMASIIDGGHLYLAQPPLYAITAGKKKQYVYSDMEKDEVIQELIKQRKAKDTKVDPSEDLIKQAGADIQRYKGLGEMNADELAETTMQPENRVLLKIQVDDAEKADAIFNKLMGEEVELRKNFIQTRAKFVKDLDV
jgi:DNA gyrase subunit B